MGIDSAARRGAASPQKYSKKHPIAAIEKRVIDSAAYASLTPSAVAVLVLLARNLEKGRNGHVWLSSKQAEEHGIEQKTLYRALGELRTRGLIYQTCRGGNGQCSKYALTWMPISKDVNGLHLGGFEIHSWRQQPEEARENASDIFPAAGRQIRAKTPTNQDKNGSRHTDKFPPIEFNTNTRREDMRRTHGACKEAANA